MARILSLQPVLLLIFLAVFLTAQVSQAAEPCADCVKADLLCGPKCLQVVCQKLGVDATVEELTALSGYALESGTSMAGLYSAAKAKGLEAAGMKISIDELMTLDVPVIAHLWNNHFGIVERGENGSVLVTDPPGEPRAVTREDFQKIYSGFALLVAKDSSKFPTPVANGADLRVDGYIWDFGVAEDGNMLEHTFVCRNEGNQDLIISKVDSTCGCAIAFVSQDTIPPGGKAEVKALLDTNGRNGTEAQTVYIHSNDPVTPVVHLQVSGVVKPSRLLYSPRTVSFGTVRRGENPSREILLPVSEARQYEIQQASSDIPAVTTGIASRADKSGYMVTLDLRSEDAPLGEVKGAVTIATNHPKDPQVTVPFTATVKGDIEVFPDTLFFGMMKQGAGARKKITISTASSQPLAIGDIENPLPDHLVLRITPAADGKEYSLTATFKQDTPAGYIKKEVVIHTNDPAQPEIKVPVYALVDG